MSLGGLGARGRACAALVAAVASAACTSATGGALPVSDPTAGTINSTRVDLPKGSFVVDNVRSAPTGAALDLAAAADRAFDLLPGVYDALGLPVNTVVSETRTFGVREGRVARRLGRTAVSRYVACGPDAIGAERADTYAVTLTALSRVSDTGGAEAAAAGRAAGLPARSTIVTQVIATAQPVSVSGQQIQCSSTGRLERAINDSEAARAAAPVPK